MVPEDMVKHQGVEEEAVVVVAAVATNPIKHLTILDNLIQLGCGA